MLSIIKSKFKEIFSKCIFRKALSNVEYLFFDNAMSVPAEHWNEVFAGNGSVCSTLPYLQCIETSISKEHSVRYLIVYKNHEPIAAFYFQLFNVRNFTVKQLLNAAYFQSLLDKLRGLSDEKLFGNNGKQRYVVINGNLFGSESGGMACKYDNDALSAWSYDKVLELLMSSLPTESTMLCCISKDYHMPHQGVIDKLENAGFKQFSIDPEMYIPIEWNSFTEYLSGMNTKYRTRVKNVLEKSKDITIKELSAIDIQHNIDVIDKLLTDIFENAPVRLANVNANFFVQQKLSFENEYKFFTLNLNGTIVGFYTAHYSSHLLSAHFVGFDYSLNKSHSIYYRILIEYVQLAIDAGVSKLVLGRDALEIKSTLGAVPRHLQLYLHVPGMFASLLVEPFLKVATAREWIQRSPFKNLQPATA